MPRHEELSEQDVRAHLATLREAQSVREMAHALGLHHAGRRALPQILARLKKRREVEESPPGRFRLAGQTRQKRPAGPPQMAVKKHGGPPGKPAHPEARDPNRVTGRIVVHRDGYGFVVPDKPIPGVAGDLFVAAAGIDDAMHGDRIEARVERRRPDGRAEGRIVQVVRRAHPTVVGIFRRGPRGNFVVPYETRLGEEIIVPPGSTPGREPAELDGVVVNVEVTRYPRGGAAAAGRVVEALGRPGDFGIDVEIIIRKHHLPHPFPEETLDAARAVPQSVPEEARRGRRDFRRLPIVTIDGETAKDFDDAVHVERRGAGFLLQVHIADVAHYVRRGSELDREARLRGTSVYFPDRAVPMLPEALSNGICSLRPREDRLVMSALLELDSEGRVTAAAFTEGVIRSVERMTYTDVNKVLEGEAEASGRYAALAEQFRLMRELALKRNARRMQRGSIDFDLPEPVIEFDASGRMQSIARSERNIAHRIIEEFMLAANEAVAAYLETRGLGSLHRVHEKPDPKKVLEFEELARAFGYTLGLPHLSERRVPVRHGRVPAPARGTRGPGHGRERAMSVSLPGPTEIDIRPQHYQLLAEKLVGKPEERIVSYLMLRSLKQARYTAEPLGHFALGADAYTHFTSPIRRYPDLVVHRVLKWALENPGNSAPRHKPGAEQPLRGVFRPAELEDIAAESSESERRADAAERELMDWKTARFMEDHLGEEYDALIISVQKFGFFVELMEIFVEGIVPVTSLERESGQRCMFRERDRSIVVGRGQRVFRLGDRIHVRAERVDPFQHRTEFSVL